MSFLSLRTSCCPGVGSALCAYAPPASNPATPSTSTLLLNIDCAFISLSSRKLLQNYPRPVSDVRGKNTLIAGKLRNLHRGLSDSKIKYLQKATTCGMHPESRSQTPRNPPTKISSPSLPPHSAPLSAAYPWPSIHTSPIAKSPDRSPPSAQIASSPHA